MSAYWSPKTAGYIPSISAGWGYSSYDAANTATISGTVKGITAAQNWYIGLQWADTFVKGNTLGMAVGQPTFVTASNTGNPQDGNYAWEWWYKFQVTDNISVSPAIFYLSNPSSAGAATGGTNNTGANVLGALVAAQFKF